MIPYATAIKYVAIVAVLATAFGAGWKINGDRWEVKYTALNSKFEQFKGGVAALGHAAEARSAIQALNDLKSKERNDEEHTRVTAAMRADIKRVRHDADSARGSFVPSAPAGAARPDLACFDRGEFESALRDFVADIRGQADEGTAATVDLDLAKVWNSERERSAR